MSLLLLTLILTIVIIAIDVKIMIMIFLLKTTIMFKNSSPIMGYADVLLVGVVHDMNVTSSVTFIGENPLLR